MSLKKNANDFNGFKGLQQQKLRPTWSFLLKPFYSKLFRLLHVKLGVAV